MACKQGVAGVQACHERIACFRGAAVNGWGMGGLCMQAWHASTAWQEWAWPDSAWKKAWQERAWVDSA